MNELKQNNIKLELSEFIFQTILMSIIAPFAFYKEDFFFTGKARIILKIFAVIIIFGWCGEVIKVVKFSLKSKNILNAFYELNRFKMRKFKEKEKNLKPFELWAKVLFTFGLGVAFFVLEKYSDVVLVLMFEMFYVLFFDLYDRWKFSSRFSSK